jgi:hypothetical protein
VEHLCPEFIKSAINSMLAHSFLLALASTRAMAISPSARLNIAIKTATKVPQLCMLSQCLITGRHSHHIKHKAIEAQTALRIRRSERNPITIELSFTLPPKTHSILM